MLGVFDIIGPVMIGPSSSHTAGAVRLGRMALAILGSEPIKAEVFLHGSFAETGKGHGTDLAIIAGLLGMKTDDEKIVDAKKIALKKGLKVEVKKEDLGPVHPNTAKIALEDEKGNKREVIGSSIGGGNILIAQIDDFPVHLTGELHTLCILYPDRLGMIARVSEGIANGGINIANMHVSRAGRTGRSLMVVETDGEIPQDIIDHICKIEGLDAVFILEPVTD